MKKKVLSVILALATALSLCACGKTSSSQTATQGPTSGTPSDENPTSGTSEVVDYDSLSYGDRSTALYKLALGEFYETYMAAKEETNLSKKFALMAVAEAKLMESAVMLPCTTEGGMYAISRVVPFTSTSTLWGNDYKRYATRLITTDLIKTSDRDAMKAKWKELAGTGEYMTWVKGYLADNGYTLKDTYAIGYTSDPETWDVLATSKAADSEAIINTYDGLMEYNVENVLSPALAESYEVSADGLTYTFKIRKGVTWVDSQGRKIADVTADDFVAGMQHMMDAQGGLEYLIEGIIVNAHEYIEGEITDFSEVGVKAVDDYTLTYTLEAPCSYFVTMLGYGVFAPMNRAYYESKGGVFGVDEFAGVGDTYTYGTTKDDIAYCGPYLVTNHTKSNTIVFKANDSYWNPDRVNVKTLTWYFNDGSDATKPYNDVKSGLLDGCNLNSSTIVLCKNDELFDTYSYVSDTNATSFSAFFTLDRTAYANVNDDTTVKSPQTAEEGKRTITALRNVHFRRAISFALDRAEYNAQVVGDDLKLNSLRNSYTPGTFVSLKEEVTIDINGTSKTYPAGTYYGQILQDQIDADGVAIKVWDKDANSGVGSSDGFDGWYNVDNAVAELNTAIEELAKEGVTIDASNPIQLDLPYPSNNESYTNKANVTKQSIEKALGGKVVVNLVECVDFEQWYYAGYLTNSGEEANYNIYDLSGWGPDYGDPSTYLDTFLPDYAGYMVKCIGIF